MLVATDMAPSLVEMSAANRMEPRLDAFMASPDVAPFIWEMPLGDPQDRRAPWVERRQFLASGGHLLVANQITRPSDPDAPVTYTLDIYDDGLTTVNYLTDRRYESVTWRRPAAGDTIDYMTTGAWVGGRPVEAAKRNRYEQLRYLGGLVRKAKPFDPQRDCLAVIEKGRGEKTRLVSWTRVREFASQGRLRAILNT
jgi:hypothetical protein